MFSFYGFILWFLLGGIKSSRQHGTRAFLHMMEIILWKSICFNFMWKRTHFPLRDFIQHEV